MHSLNLQPTASSNCSSVTPRLVHSARMRPANSFGETAGSVVLTPNRSLGLAPKASQNRRTSEDPPLVVHPERAGLFRIGLPPKSPPSRWSLTSSGNMTLPLPGITSTAVVNSRPKSQPSSSGLRRLKRLRGCHPRHPGGRDRGGLARRLWKSNSLTSRQEPKATITPAFSHLVS